MGVMNKILILLGITTVIFIGVVLGFVWYGKAVPDSLIYSYFAAIGTEGFIMGWIKNAKCKSNSECIMRNSELKEGEKENG
jgi:hypothetical protein